MGLGGSTKPGMGLIAGFRGPSVVLGDELRKPAMVVIKVQGNASSHEKGIFWVEFFCFNLLKIDNTETCGKFG